MLIASASARPRGVPDFTDATAARVGRVLRRLPTARAEAARRSLAIDLRCDDADDPWSFRTLFREAATGVRLAVWWPASGSLQYAGGSCVRCLMGWPDLFAALDGNIDGVPSLDAAAAGARGRAR